MDLQKHARAAKGARLLLQGAVNADHRLLDDVGSRSLYRSVDRLSLGVQAQVLLAIGDQGEVNLSAEEGFDIPSLATELDGVRAIVSELGVACKVKSDQVLRLRLAHAQLL